MALLSFPQPISREGIRSPFRGVDIRRVALYPPALLLGLGAAYASSKWAAHAEILPWALSWGVGAAFEYTYLAAIAIGGKVDKRQIHWFYLVNLVALLTSVLYVTLWSAERYGLLDHLLNQRGWKWAFAVSHGLPLATLNFLYNMLLRAYEAQEHEAAVVAAKETAHTCPYCEQGFPSKDARNGHMGRCAHKT